MISVGFARVLGVLLFLGGCALVALNGYATWLQGGTWAVTDGGKFIAKWTAITIEVVGVVLVGFAAGSAWSAKQRFVGFGLGVVMIVSGAMVVNSIASFRATERLSASKTREAAMDRVAAADKLQTDSAKEVLKFAGKNADDKGARRDFIGANEKAVKAFRDAPVEVKVAPDAGAELWATAFGLTVYRVQMILSALDAVWQVVLSMVCFPAAGFFMNPFGWLKSSSEAKTAPELAPETKTQGSSEPSKSGSGGSGGAEPPRIRQVHPAPEQTTVARTTEAASLPPPEPPKVSNVGSRVSTDAPKGKLSYEQLHEVLSRQIAGVTPKQTTRANAKATGWSQSTTSRIERRLKAKAERVKRRSAVADRSMNHAYGH